MGSPLRFGLLIVLCIGSTTVLLAQTTTWTGGADTDWDTPGNWSAGVPTATLDVVIPSVSTNQPILSTTAVANSVEVQSGASMSITAAGSLTINGSKNVNGSLASFFNSGTVTNEGQLVISNTTLAGSYGLWNLATFTNSTGGVIMIDGANFSSLLNQSGSFTNAAQITIGATAYGGNSGIRNQATFTNTVGGAIAIDRTGSYGLYNFSGNFINAAVITIGSKIPETTGDCGLINRATFTNNPESIITIDGTFATGLFNQSGSFTNAAQITIGNTSGMAVLNGLVNSATFNNTGCEALLNVGPTTEAGIRDGNSSFGFSGTLTNSGNIIENASTYSYIANNSGLVRNLGGGGFNITTNTGVLTTLPGGAGVSITASPSLTVTQGQTTTLTASGTTSYTWSTGETTPSILVSLAGTYSVSGTLGSCSSATSVSVNITPPPDLTPIVYARPNTIYGPTGVTVVVDVVELVGVPTRGFVSVRLTRDAQLNLNYPPTATSVNNRSVQNSLWQFGAYPPGYYTLVTNQPVAAGNKLSFGFIGNLTPGATTGSLTVSAVVVGGSGGEVQVNNNADSDKIDYFQQ